MMKRQFGSLTISPGETLGSGLIIPISFKKV